MARRRPPGGAAGISSSFIAFLLFFPLIAAAQQQHAPQNGYQRSPREGALGDSYATQRKAGRQQPLDTTRKTNQNTPLKPDDERALATLAPADSHLAVRATPPQYPAGTAGGPSKGLQRSLDDWKVEDFVLLATVDGSLHASDRNNGEERWAIGTGKPMVKTIHHRLNRSSEDGFPQDPDFMWILEPSQDGSIYVFQPGMNGGVHRTGLTVKQLVELSPYASDEHGVVYTADKTSQLYTVDASTGSILKMFSSGGSKVIGEGSCRRISGLEMADDDECEGFVTVGRTDYTVSIQDIRSGETMCTIEYFEWTPNNRDSDLGEKYSATMDNSYIYSRPDGTILAVSYDGKQGKSSETPEHSLRYHRKFDSPVVRVFDIARHHHAASKDTSLVLLPQPVGPAFNEDKIHDLFVNCTEEGSWYAMSELNYPAITDELQEAKWYSTHSWDDMVTWDNMRVPTCREFVGKHSLENYPHYNSQIPLIGPSPPEQSATNEKISEVKMENKSEPLVSAREMVRTRPNWITVIITLILVIFASGGAYSKGWFRPSKAHYPEVTNTVLEPPGSSEPAADAPQTEAAVGAEAPVPQPTEERRVRFEIPDESPPGDQSSLEATEETADAPAPPAQSDGGEPAPAADAAEAAQETPKKKKTHRGQRGGRRRKKTAKPETEEGEPDAVGRIVKNISQEHTLQPDEITVGGQNMQDVSGLVQINNLVINTDRILGNGSGGTFVFEGRFGGREVAVKRMLGEYFELARQEVELLEQSDDHPNVIRYFCHQRDQNFLYIAVELCQASLWDLYHDGRREEDLTEIQMKLRNEISTDAPRVLYQLAAGLNHLHSLRIIHRDIKPQNILIAYPKKNQIGGPRFVISDFGLCKTLPDNASTLIGTTGNAGTVGWKAPELISKPRDAEGRSSSTGHSRESSSGGDPVPQGVKRAVDIFSLGCVFFYVLTSGSHPFDDDEGWAQIREYNIKKNKSKIDQLRGLGDDCQEPVDLISKMLSQKPEDRPTAVQVMRHPFFWSPEKRLAFLCDCSDQWERECRDPPSPELQILESYSGEVIGHPPRADFLAKLGHKFVDTLGKQRKYTGDRMLDLLRALRNKKNHYEDMPPDVKAMVGPLPGGYLRYWTIRFPTLLMKCYDAVQECGWQDLDRFKPYFQNAALA